MIDSGHSADDYKPPKVSIGAIIRNLEMLKLVFDQCLEKNYNIFQARRFNHTIIIFKLTD